jgi:hypothetical protein
MSLCLLCFEADDEVVALLPCQHEYHLACVRSVSHPPSCPTCSAPVLDLIQMDEQEIEYVISLLQKEKDAAKQTELTFYMTLLYDSLWLQKGGYYDYLPHLTKMRCKFHEGKYDVSVRLYRIFEWEKSGLLNPAILGSLRSLCDAFEASNENLIKEKTDHYLNICSRFNITGEYQLSLLEYLFGSQSTPLSSEQPKLSKLNAKAKEFCPING